MDGLSRLNDRPAAEVRAELLRCCGSSRWVDGSSPASLRRCGASTPPRNRMVGARAGRLARGVRRPSSDRRPSRAPRALREQGGVGGRRAGGCLERARRAARRPGGGNRAYEERFGYIFIVCATGKGAAEMLARSCSAGPPSPGRAPDRGGRAGENHAPSPGEGGERMSGITTHVLDTSMGRPAAGVAVRLIGGGRQGRGSR